MRFFSKGKQFGLCFSFLAESLSGIGVGVMLVSRNDSKSIPFSFLTEFEKYWRCMNSALQHIIKRSDIMTKYVSPEVQDGLVYLNQ